MRSVQELEDLATKYYGADPDQQAYARSVLDLLWRSNDGLEESESTFRVLFSESSNPYALMYSSQAVVVWVHRNGRVLRELGRRTVILQSVFDALRRMAHTAAAHAHSMGSSGISCSTFSMFGSGTPVGVIKALMASYAKLTKLGFVDEPFLSEGVNWAVGLVTQASEDVTYNLGLLLLDAMLVEFGSYDSTKYKNFLCFSDHRRASCNFRNTCILEVAVTALTALERVLHQAGLTHLTIAGLRSDDPIPPLGCAAEGAGPSSVGGGGGVSLLAPQQTHLPEVVSLIERCLSYDFMAIYTDETEEVMSSQFPVSWRYLLMRRECHALLWKSLDALPLPHCTTMMKGIASVCGIRRTFFESVEERLMFLDSFFSFFLEALQNQLDHRLQNPGYMAQVAEACFRFIGPFGYKDLHCSSVYIPWIAAIRTLAMEILQRPFEVGCGPEGGGAAGGVSSFVSAGNTMLTFWARLLSSMRMFSPIQNELSDSNCIRVTQEYAVEIVRRFFETRVCPTCLFPPSDDQKMLVESVMLQCENIAQLCQTFPAMQLTGIGEYLYQMTVERLCTGSPFALLWLFYVAGSFVRGVLSTIEEQAVHQVTYFFRFAIECVVFRSAMAERQTGMSVAAMDVTDPSSLFGTLVEQALLYFLTNVVSILCVDSLDAALKVVVQEVFEGRENMYQFLLTHTGGNVMRRVDSSCDSSLVDVIRSSIELIQNVCSHMPAEVAQNMRFELPRVDQLPLSMSIQTYRLRTPLYHMLWPLRMPAKYSLSAFLEFLSPIDFCFQETLNGSGMNPSYIAGWLRDLGGVAKAVRENAAANSDFVCWFCDRAPSLQLILDGPAGDSPLVVISFLRFANLLVASKRAQFYSERHSHSCTGLVLFKVLSNFIQQIIGKCITDDKVQVIVSGGPIDGVYEMMLKPLLLSMMLLSTFVADDIAPFGAMWFYNDETYDNTLLGLLRMLPVFPSRVFKEYPKMADEAVLLLSSITVAHAFYPLVKLSSSELESILNFVIERCEDVDLRSVTLTRGLTFLQFIADMIRDVKELSTLPVGSVGHMNLPEGGGRGVSPVPTSTTTPPRSPGASSYYVDGVPYVSLSSTTIPHNDTGIQRCQRTVSVRSVRAARRGLAQLLEPIQGLWTALIRVAMNVIVHQDRALSTSCSVLYPIFDAHPPFWYEFCEEFSQSYPRDKQPAVRDALAALSKQAQASEGFYTEMLTFRRKLRDL